MNKSIFTLALAASVLAPGFALARDNGERNEAIRLCVEEVVSRTGLNAEQVRFDELRVGRNTIRVDVDVWRGNQLQNVRCDVARGEALTIAALVPALVAETADLSGSR